MLAASVSGRKGYFSYSYRTVLYSCMFLRCVPDQYFSFNYCSSILHDNNRRVFLFALKYGSDHKITMITLLICKLIFNILHTTRHTFITESLFPDSHYYFPSDCHLIYQIKNQNGNKIDVFFCFCFVF